MIDLDEVREKIHAALRGEKYGLTSAQIKKRANIDLPPQLIGLICAWDTGIVCVNTARAGKRWRLINNGQGVRS